MKKILLSIICLTMVGIQSATAITAQIALRHQGNVTQFNPDELPSAIEAAVDGDTILLSAGTFDCGSGITIAKAITIIGAGAENTIFKNRIDIYIPDNPTLTAHLLDGVRITGALYVDDSVIGLKLRKCVIDGGISAVGNLTIIREMLIDRCKTGVIALSSRFMDMTNWVSNAAVNNDISFTNCLGPSDFWEKWAGATQSNCYTYTPGSTEVDNPDNFIKLGWLGTDDTAVGMYGGTTPFSLEPNAPKVTNYTIGVDTKTHTLNVKMTLSAN